MADAPSSESGGESAASTTKILIHKCRNCGNEEKDTDSTVCVSKTYFKQTDVHLANVVNEYTHLDPTLPRIKSMKCPNINCETNTALDVPCTVLYIRYDDTNLKFVYMCSTCKYTWNTEQYRASSS